MANIKVSEMTEATVFDDGDYTMIIQGNTSKKISHENMLGDIEDNIGNLSNLTTTNKTDLVSAINETNTNITNITGQILWTNPSPTSAFATQNITLSSSDYDMYEAIFYGSITGADTITTGRIPKGKNFFLAQTYNTGAGDVTRNRKIQYVSDTEMTVTDGTQAETTNNNVNIPVYIIGYKTGLFS